MRPPIDGLLAHLEPRGYFSRRQVFRRRSIRRSQNRARRGAARKSTVAPWARGVRSPGSPMPLDCHGRQRGVGGPYRRSGFTV
jgi:hypothetical protein